MNFFREAEWIDAQKLCNFRIRTKYMHIFPTAKHILVFAFSWFNDHEIHSTSIQLPQQFVDRITLTRTCRASNKGMCCKCLPVQDKVRFFLPAHMVDFAQLHLVRIRHRFVRHIAAELRVLDDWQAVH